MTDPGNITGVHPTGKPRVPRQSTRIGRAGYKGDVEVYEPGAPNVPIVKEVEAPAETKEVKRRHRRKADAPIPLPEGDAE